LTSLIGKVEKPGKASIRLEGKYENCLGKTYKKEFLLDFSELYGLRRVGESPLVEISKELRKIREDIHCAFSSSYPRIKLVAFTKKDMEEEGLKLLEEERLFEEEEKRRDQPEKK
jgi:hypothetical protein